MRTVNVKNITDFQVYTYGYGKMRSPTVVSDDWAVSNRVGLHGERVRRCGISIDRWVF